MEKRKTYIVVALLTVLLFGMSACGSSSDDVSTKNQSKPGHTSQSTDDASQSDTSSTDSTVTSDNSGESNENEQASSSEGETKDTAAKAIDNNSDSKASNKEDNQTLFQYSNKQIEYARVWLLLGENKEVDELNVTNIPAGTPINPNDKTSATYPVDVIQLAGARLVDGSVTYNGNGDGTINVYQVPLRWESNVPEELDEDYMSNYTKSIIDDAELVYVDPGNDEDIIELIKVLNIHH